MVVRITKTLALCLLAGPFVWKDVNAQVFECANVWQSYECGTLPIGTTSKPDAQLQMEKSKVAEELLRFADQVREETKHADLDVLAIRSYCLNQGTTLDECRTRALKADKALVADLRAHRKRIQKERELVQRGKELTFRREKFIADLRRRGNSKNKPQ